jgi:ABC-type transport system involved in multi-copper enzyme maturation permease subunit
VPTSLTRELAIALRARVTWGAAFVGALVVGHGFVLATDIYSSSSRSALADVLMRREMDPLAAVVRPTLGGAELAVAVLVPVIAARVLAVEKERRTFGALAIARGSTWAVVLPKLAAAVVASTLVIAPAVLLLGLFAALGGHLDPFETAIAIGAHLLHAVFLASASIAAAAWTRTTAQATALALVVSLGSWMASAGEGLSALAWMGPLERVSISRVLAPLEHGIVSLGSLAWLVVAIGSAVAAAAVGARLDSPARSRVVSAFVLVLATGLSLDATTRVGKAYDWTELRRASLPPAVVDGLRDLPGEIRIQVWLDREDSRRRQLERDALSKIRLARGDVRIEMPLDATGSSLARDDAYGRVVIEAGGRSGETRSASRKEIVTRIFEIAGRPVPDFAQVPYPGYPLALDAAENRLVRVFAYLVVPGMVVVLGAFVTRRRRK